MIMYKGYKAVYLGLMRWRITAPDGLQFDITLKGGVWELCLRIRYWRGYR